VLKHTCFARAARDRADIALPCGSSATGLGSDRLSVRGQSCEVRRVDKTLILRCPCGGEHRCDCKSTAINFAARLLDRFSGQAVRDADELVPDLRDDEAAEYGALRDAFLRQETQRYRSVERARRAAADDKLSQGGECVYCVLSADGKLKIGTSSNVEKRFDTLQTSASVKLTLLLTLPGGTELETTLHRRFAHLRESGEWFTYADEIRYFVEGAAFYKSSLT